jgi:hypothetical protein
MSGPVGRGRLTADACRSLRGPLQRIGHSVFQGHLATELLLGLESRLGEPRSDCILNLSQLALPVRKEILPDIPLYFCEILHGSQQARRLVRLAAQSV